jgi:hypothetical protein
MKMFYQTGQKVEDGDLTRVKTIHNVFNLLLVKVIDGKYFVHILCEKELLPLETSPYFSPIKEGFAKLVNIRLIFRKQELNILATTQVELIKERLSKQFRLEPSKEILNKWHNS